MLFYFVRNTVQDPTNEKGYSLKNAVYVTVKKSKDTIYHCSMSSQKSGLGLDLCFREYPCHIVVSVLLTYVFNSVISFSFRNLLKLK